MSGVRRRAALAALPLGAVELAACVREQPPAAVLAYPERSLAYAPLLLAVKRGLWGEPPLRLALTQRIDGQAVARAVASDQVLAGALALPDLVRAVSEGAPLVGIGALTSRLDCHLVISTTQPFPVSTNSAIPLPTLFAIHAGLWRGLRVGVEAGADGTEAFVRLFAVWADASRFPPQPPFVPRAPQRQVAAAHALDSEARWSVFDTDAGLAAALADRRLEAFVGRPYAAAQALSYGSGQLGRSLAEGGEHHVLAALPTVLVTRNDAGRSGEESLLRRILGAIARASSELAGHEGASAARAALPERDALHLALAHRLTSPNPASTAFSLDARLDDEPFRRYLELSAMAGARFGVSAGALTTNRFIG